MNGQDLTVRSENKMVTDITWNTLYKQAAEIIKSGFLPPAIKTPAQAIAVILTGRELGIGMMESFRGIHIIDNRPSISPQLMMSLIYNSGVAENIKIESTETYCVVSGNRKGQPVITTKFTEEDAKSLNLLFKDNWKKQKQNMLRWRAISAWARLTCPDVIGGLYTPEELENSDDIVGKDTATLELSEKLNSDPTLYEKWAEETMAKILDDIQICENPVGLSHIRHKFEKEIGQLMEEDRNYIVSELEHKLQLIVSDATQREPILKADIIQQGEEKSGIPHSDTTEEELIKKEAFSKDFVQRSVVEINACDTTAALTVWKNKNTPDLKKCLKEYEEYVKAYFNTKWNKLTKK